MTLFETDEFKNLDKIDKVIIIDKKIEDSDKVEEDAQFRLDLITAYRTRLLDERSKHI